MANKYGDAICEAIEYLASKAVSKAEYDKTIIATVISCIDKAAGQYKMRYQDSTFYAYSNDIEKEYATGLGVYVLVPGNNFSNRKTIIGVAAGNGTGYVAEVKNLEDRFEKIGNNCVDSENRIYELCSYRNDEIDLYNRDNNINEIQLNEQSINTYFKEGNYIILGGTIRTNLPFEQQHRGRGDYGIGLELAYTDDATGKEVIRKYILGKTEMVGDPDKLISPTRQYQIYNIDKENFLRIRRLYIFSQNWPNQGENYPSDIFISKLELYAASALSEQDLDTTILSLNTPSGAFFDIQEDITKKPIQAQLRVKGKNLNPSSLKASYYWFIENMNIYQNSTNYNSYGGPGWECLNRYNRIDENTLDWIPESFVYNVDRNKSLAFETKYKCVAVYNNLILSKEIVFKDYRNEANKITIESDLGTKFYHDLGTPDLTCLINGIEEIGSEYEYAWAKFDNNTMFTKLLETSTENDEYQQAKDNYENLLTEINNQTVLKTANEQTLNDYKNIYDNYTNITRVDNNKVYKVQVNEINNYATYKCTVIKNEQYLGTASIILTNDLLKENGYNLVINNGVQIFKYDADGMSPARKELLDRYIIQPLTFTIYDDQGKALPQEIIDRCEIKWLVPTQKTMIQIPTSGYESSGEDEVTGKTIYEGYSLFNYSIKNIYNNNYDNNDIELQVSYKDIFLTTKTKLTFAKDGENGTNGTEYYLKIVPNVRGRRYRFYLSYDF